MLFIDFEIIFLTFQINVRKSLFYRNSISFLLCLNNYLYVSMTHMNFIKVDRSFLGEQPIFLHFFDYPEAPRV